MSERVCVVAGAGAWPFYLATGAWVGQENRRFGDADPARLLLRPADPGPGPADPRRRGVRAADGRGRRHPGAECGPGGTARGRGARRRAPRRGHGAPRLGGAALAARRPRHGVVRTRRATTPTRRGRCSSASPTSTACGPPRPPPTSGAGDAMTASSREARRTELRAWYDDARRRAPRARGRVRHPPRRRHPRRPPRRRPAGDADQGRGELPRRRPPSPTDAAGSSTPTRPAS